ncbi:MAG: isochorismatase family protein [Actinobacteria bacterium]|nr:isochorismatase family protein [Actinomycetota bacterium]
MEGQSLEEDYTRAGFGAPLDFGRRPALLVVDFVRAYLDRDSPLYAGVEGALASAARVLEAARNAGVPRLFSRVRYRADARDGGLFVRKVPALQVFASGSPLGEIAEELTPRDDEFVIDKQYASAFFGTPLASTLTTLQVDTTVIIGLSTSGCVRASAVDALQHGFVPVVVADAVGDRDPRPHHSNLFDLQAKYAEVVGEALVCDWLLSLGPGGRRRCRDCLRQ